MWKKSVYILCMKIGAFSSVQQWMILTVNSLDRILFLKMMFH